MIFFFLFIINIIKVQTHLLGNWPDTNFDDEKQQFTDSLFMFDSNSKNILTQLLNLSLAFKVFNPKASILKNVSSKISFPKIRGFSATKTINPEPQLTPNIQWKYITYLYQENLSNLDKLNFMKEMALNFSSICDYINNIEVNVSLIQSFINHNKQYQKCMAVINGRIVPPLIHSVIETLIQEYNNIQIAEFLNFTNSQIDHLHHSKIFSDPHVYIPVPDYHFGLNIMDIEANSQLFLQTTIDPKDPTLNVRKRLIRFDFFVKFNDKRSLPLLKAFYEDISVPHYISAAIYPIFNSGNETERKIAFAFYHILLKGTDREALNFLIEGLYQGYEKAYQSSKMYLKWELLEMLMNPSTSEFQFSEYVSKYATKNYITETTLLVNGQITPFKGINPKILFQRIGEIWAKIYHKIIPKYNISIDSNLDEIFRKNFVVMNRIYVEIPNKFTHFLELNYKSQIEITKILSKLPIILTNGNENQIPVFVTTKKIIEKYKNLFNDNIKFNVSFIYISPENFNELLKFGFNFNYNQTKMLIGCHIIEDVPSIEDFTFLLQYLYKCYGKDLKDFNHMQMIYIYLWRTSQYANGIKRIKHLKYDNNFLVSLNNNNSLKCEFVVDPFDESFPDLMSIIYHLYKHNFSINILHSINYNKIMNLPDHLKKYHFYAFDNDFIETDETYELKFPSNFEVIKIKNDFYIQKVVITGIISDVYTIEIGNQIKAPTKDEGFFMMKLPIGKHKTKGIYDKLVNVDKLSPIFLRLLPKKEKIHFKKDNSLNVLTYIENSTTELQTINMMKSFQKNNKNKNIKFWVIGTFQHFKPNFNVEQLPILFSPNIDIPNNYNDKLRLIKLLNLDIYFPPTIRKLLFCDPKIIWIRNVTNLFSLNMKNSIIAIPEISNINKKNCYFMSLEMLEKRQKRPFHNTVLFFVDLKKWFKENCGEYIRDLYQRKNVNEIFNEIDNEIMNIAQLGIQTLTLPPETAFCDLYTDKNKVKNALSVLLCSEESYKYIDEYRENENNEL